MNIKSIASFFKAQASAFIGGVTDYTLMIVLTEVFRVHFTVSIIISGVIGGAVNFTLNYFWAFKSKGGYAERAIKQIYRFGIVVLGSVTLKSTGTHLLFRYLKLDYKIGRLLIDSIVSYGFNYPMMKFWVFNIKPIQTNTHKLEQKVKEIQFFI